MKFNKVHLLNLFILIAFVLESLASADVVYDNTSDVYSVMWTTEIGDTVTLAGTKRFINSFAIGMYVGAHIGETENLILRFYLPNAPGESPGRLIWQSPPLYDVPLTEEVQLITFDVPEFRVPNILPPSAARPTMPGPISQNMILQLRILRPGSRR